MPSRKRPSKTAGSSGDGADPSEEPSEAAIEQAIEEAIEAARDARDADNLEEASAIMEAVVAKRPEHAIARLLAAEYAHELGANDVAEGHYRAALKLNADDGLAWSGLALVLFSLLRFDEARAAAARAIRIDSLDPEAYFVRGLLRERRGDSHGAARDLHRAHRIDPNAFPKPVPLDDATVEAVVDEVVESLHPSLRTYLSEVAIVLEDFPDEAVCRSFEPPMPPHEILGFFSGSSLAERADGAPWARLPPTIVLFRRNLERAAVDREQMIEELRVTVFHEIGHFLGLDEDDVDERGLH